MRQTAYSDRLAARNITLEQLRAFVFIAECGGFGRAGAYLGRSQSTLSASLRRLEDEVGSRLIERHQGHILGLTEDGQRLLPAARDILLRTHRAFNGLKKTPMNGRVALGVPDDFHLPSLHEILSLCLEENPNLRVEITAASSSVLASMAAQQQLDVVILKGLAGQSLLAQTERILRVETLHWVGVGAAQFRDLEEIALVAFPAGCVLRECATAALDRVGRAYYFAYVSGAFDNIRSAVTNGLGIGVLPSSALRDDLQVLTLEAGAPSLPAIQLVMRVVRSGKLYQNFGDCIARGMGLTV